MVTFCVNFKRIIEVCQAVQSAQYLFCKLGVVLFETAIRIGHSKVIAINLVRL